MLALALSPPGRYFVSSDTPPRPLNEGELLKEKSLLGVILIAVVQLAAAGLQSAFAQPGRAAGFWDLFGESYQGNCRMWKHNTERNPVLPKDSVILWKETWTANPATLHFKGRHLLYYRGHGRTPANPKGHDRLAVAEIVKVTRGEFVFSDLNGKNFIVDVGLPGAFDDADVLDPSAIEFHGKVMIYYSGVGTGPNSVGLAVSDDGEHFTKMGKVMEGRAPSAIVKNDKVYVLYQKDSGRGWLVLYLAVSDDGVHFEDVQEEPVFKGQEGGWDKYVTTGRLYQEGGEFLLIYGGSPDLNDQPDYFGIARSRDLLIWEKHRGNPVFGLSAKGEADGGAIWFPALIETPDAYVLLYEGSRGRYAWDLSSQICMSSIEKQGKR
jgi:predicted GH43/DUF377 family glycosyl hydrolase